MESWILRVSCKISMKPFGLHLLCMRPEVFMIPWTFQKLNSFLKYHNLLPEWEQYTFWTAKNDWVSRVVPSAYFSISDYQLSSNIRSMKLNQQNLLLLYIHFNSCIDFLPDCLVMPQKFMFKSWDSHAVWTWFVTALICKHDVTQERVGALTDHYDNAFFFCDNVASAYDFVAT